MEAAVAACGGRFSKAAVAASSSSPPSESDLPRTSPAMSSVLDDSDISSEAVITEVIDMAYDHEKAAFMDSWWWAGQTNPARRVRNLEVDHNSPIETFGNAGWYFAMLRR